MKTMMEIFKNMYGKQFEVKIDKSGVRKYYTWSISSINCGGNIIDLGVSYNKEITLVSADDTTIIDIIDMNEEEYLRYSYVSDIEKYETAVGVKCEDLIGFSCDEFYQEINKRIKTKENK